MVEHSPKILANEKKATTITTASCGISEGISIIFAEGGDETSPALL